MSLSLAAPTRRATRATLPARGRDASPMSRLGAASLVQYEAFELIHDNHAAPIPPLYGEGGARSATGGVLSSRRMIMADDWKKSLPFPAHWLSYLFFKLLVLALAILAALHFWDVI